MGRKRKGIAKKASKKPDNEDVEDWECYMDLKKRKLMAQYDHDKGLCIEQLTDIFKDVAIFVNGWTRPSAEELKVLMTKHGGVYHTYQMSTTTHIVASNLAHAKMKHIGSVPIVKPQWITESIDMQKLLDYRRYLLFTNQSTTQPRLQFPVIPKLNSNAPADKREATASSVTATEEIKKNIESPLGEELKMLKSLEQSNFLNNIQSKFEEDTVPQSKTEESTSSTSSTFESGNDGNVVIDIQENNTRNTGNLSTVQNNNQSDLKEAKISTAYYESDDDIFGDTSPQQGDLTKDISAPENTKASFVEEACYPATMSEPSTSEVNAEVKGGALIVPVDVSKGIKEPGTSKRLFDERRNNVAKTAADPTFLKEFYNHSRLHLISTLSAEFKQLVLELREKSDGKFPGKDTLIQKKSCSADAYGRQLHTPVIMHIDMDCFFVSVGLRRAPHLRGRPVAVTHGRSGFVQANGDRVAELELRAEHSNPEVAQMFSSMDANASMSEVASCSYEARRCGVKNGMFLGTALRLCPDLQTIPYDFQGYREVSTTLYKTVASYTLDIEAVSCDEMYVDCTKLLQDTGLTVAEWASHVRAEITARTGCPCSTGFGANRLQARLATKKAKPAGQFHLTAEDIEAYMQDVPLSDIPGVGYSTLAKLKGLGLSTCGDVQMASVSTLKQELGQKNGETLYQQARGVDNRPLNFDHRRKTVSTEVNYGIRFKTLQEAYGFLKSLSQEVFERADTIGMRAKCVTLKLLVRAANAPVQTAKYLGHGICDSVTKSSTLPTVLPFADSIFREVKTIYDRLNVPFEDLRGVGIHLTKLEKNRGQKKTLMSFCKTKNAQAENKVAPLEAVIPLKEEEFSKEIGEVNRSPEMQWNAREISPKPGPSKSSTEIRTDTLNNGRSSSGDTANPLSSIKTEKTTLSAASIDLQVLKELPEEIRKEIMKEYKIQDVTEQQMHTENENDQGINIGTARRSEYACTEFVAPEAATPESPFHTISWEEVKSVVKSWMTAEKEPGFVDTEMLGIFCKELAELRRIEDLKIFTSFLYRTLETKDCKWHRAYFEIVNTAQQGMVARYGSTLLVGRAYSCCRHC